MKLTRNQTIAAAVAGAIAVVAGGTAIHAASVHEQNCLSYERQAIKQMTTMKDLVAKAQEMMAMVNENPFAAFGLLGELLPMQTEVQNTAKSINDIKYAYVKTCGEPRFNKFVERPEVKTQVEAISSGAAALSN